jgi:two-component system NtrC family sensor kinase
MTIRFKLMLVAIAAILLANTILSIIGVWYLGRVWLDEVQRRVRLDLNSARAAYNGQINRIESFLSAASLDQQLSRALSERDEQTLDELLARVHRTGGTDLLCLVDSSGRVVRRATGQRAGGDDLSGNLLVQEALERQTAVSGTIVLSREQLAREDAQLAERAHFDLLETKAAVPTEERSRSNGMVVASAVPIFDPEGHVVGALYAGNLLNRRYEIVDAIKKEVFPDDRFVGQDVGTVTIFQGDLRVATNVTTGDGQRAVGTRLSRAVYDVVLVEGRIFAAPAFVVNDWYITAYEPIRNPQGEIIGALYVGLLRAPFVTQRNTIAGGFLALVLATSVACLAVLFFVSKLVLKPIERIVAMSRRVIAGDMTARVDIRPPGEFGVLCRAVDEMADAVANREAELKRLTRRQIGRAQKLASIGRLAAGVAHEINNPLTGVLTFAHLLREKGHMQAEDVEDLDLIIRETSRAADIVRGLLDFSRDRPAHKEPFEVNEAIHRTIQLLRTQQLFHRIDIREEYQDKLPKVEGDVNQLQQVLLNLSLNACGAMLDGGDLTIRTSADDGRVLIEVTDTGCGIAPEDLDQIFEPFFSTKPAGQGTGLGLSVSYGIVRRHGGTIQVESEPGKGSKFTIILPALGSEPIAN